MQIVVKDADFSAISIGKYASKKVRELLSVYSEITESQIIAVNTFLLSLGYGDENSIYTKIKHLFLPCVSSTLDEALYDLVDKRVITTTGGTVLFDSIKKTVNVSADTRFEVSSYSAIHSNPFAASSTTKAANGMAMNDFVGVRTIGAYFGSSNLSYATISPQKEFVLITAQIGDTSLNASDVKLVNETGVSKPFSTSDKVYPAKTVSKLFYANSAKKDAEDNILGWADGLTEEEGIVIKNALGVLLSDLEL